MQLFSFFTLNYLCEWLETEEDDLLEDQHKENHPLVEVLMIISVNLFYLFLLVLLTSFKFGSAYTMFWWTGCFNLASIFALAIAFMNPKVRLLFFDFATLYPTLQF